ncbi:MAG: hypothetical protein R3E58_10820 [Phycisphaerae bacterium]
MNPRRILKTVAASLMLSASLTPANAADLVVGSEQSIPFTGAYEEFTIPATNPPTYLQLTVFGGDGGDAYAGQNLECFARGGQGGTAEAIFRVGYGFNELEPGGTIRFIVGGEGTIDENDNGGSHGGGGGSPVATSGGGGGSGVIYRAPGNSSNACGADWIVLVAAGGGGGATQGSGFGCVNGHDGGNAQTGECGRDGAGSTGGDGGCDGQEGENGGSNGGGGGAGAYGESGSSGAAGKGCPTGGDGGTDGTDGGWGFGGGGYASGSHSGGGGGYSGGGGGGGNLVNEGGGGGSYVSPWGISRRITSDNGGRSDGEALYLCIDDSEFCTSSEDCNENGVPDDCDLDGPGRFDDFGSPDGEFIFYGSADIDSESVLLTPATPSQSGSVIFAPATRTPIDSFSVKFDYKMGGGTGADGISFIIFNVESPGDLDPGEHGGGQPLAVSLDTYQGNAAGGNHAEILSYGTSISRVPVAQTLDNNRWQHAFILFENGELTLVLQDEWLNETTIFDAVPVPGFSPIRAGYGFGARTGGATNAHRVDNVRFKVVGLDNDCDANGTPDDCQTDSNNDGVPNACDDDDGDGVPNHEDQCPEFDDHVDADGDGVADRCDPCPNDSPDDSDGDGVCDSDDICAGVDDNGPDDDGDSIPNECDPCPNDNPDDSDGDGVCDSNDICAGVDDNGPDDDGDSIPNECDTCPDAPNVWNQTQDTYHATIAQAIASANNNDVIELGACTFHETNIDDTNKAFTIRGQGPDLTILDGGQSNRILNLVDPDVTIEDLTLRNGLANNGGAAHVVFGNATFRNCRFENNGNDTTPTGAVHVKTSHVEFDRCVFSANESNDTNTSASSIRVESGEVYVRNCLFNGDRSPRHVVNVNVVAGIEPTAFASLLNCTFADFDGQDFIRARNGGTTLFATNSIFDGSAGAINAGSGVAQIITHCLYPGATGINLDGLPTFVNASTGDFRLAAGSLGIDAANRDAYFALGGEDIDLNGDPRLHDDTGVIDTGVGALTFLDMGAFEFQGTTVDCNGNGADDANDISLGTSADCNGNTVPDECELADNDCNANGVPDECELDGNDCNGNEIPDECESELAADADGDGIPDACDMCPDSPNVYNPSQDTFYPTIADAIDASTSGEVIELGACVFVEHDLILDNKNITLRGQGADQTILDGDGVAAKFMQIRNGSDCTVEDITFQNGISSGTIGGALRIGGQATALIKRCHFQNNRSGTSQVGAVFAGGGSVSTFEHCVFEDNHSDNLASAVSLLGANTTVRFVNSLFNGNDGSAYFTALNDGGTMEFVNCTFVENQNQQTFGASHGGQTTIHNSIHDDTTISSTFIDFIRCLFPGATGDNIDGLPTFVDAANGDFRLAAGSLGIDAADYDTYVAAGGDATDLNGDPRAHDDTGTADTGSGAPAYLDLGAFEFQGTTQCGGGGDFNNSGSVDLDDYRSFTPCMEGPEVLLESNCGCFDLDSDGDVDVRDFAEFQKSFTGSR